MMTRKKKLLMVWCCIVIVMLISSCMLNVAKHNSSQNQIQMQRGLIFDRNGIALVSNDTIVQSDSIGTMMVRKYLCAVAGQLLGFVGETTSADIDNEDSYVPGDIIGRSGVEKSYEKVLRGEGDKPGRNLTLTIDYELQKLGEELMEGKLGCIVAIEPSTGEVLCMVSSPTYNPQLLSGFSGISHKQSLQQDSLKPLLNRCIMTSYSPGGIFNIAQGLVLLSEGIITPQTRYPCERGFKSNGVSIGCHGHLSPLTLAEALSTACNSYFCYSYLDMMKNAKYGTVQVALEKWRDYMFSIGFGDRFGIDLPNEKRGVIPNANCYDLACKGQWDGLTILGNAIGQGEISVTPLQLANMSAIIANRGHYYIPHVVKEIEGGTIDEKYKNVQSTIISSNVYDSVIQGMRLSVLSGTCRGLSRLPIESCGISGTASSRGKNHSAFIGFAPVEKPKIAIAVYVEGGEWGAKYAAPIGGIVMEKFLNGKLSVASNENADQMRKQHISYKQK